MFKPGQSEAEEAQLIVSTTLILTSFSGSICGGKKRICLRSALAALSDNLSLVPSKIDYRSSALPPPRLEIGNPFCCVFLLSEYCLPRSTVQWLPFLE